MYVYNNSLKWAKQQVKERLRVVIPPAITTTMNLGKYPITLFGTYLFDLQRYPIIYKCKDVGIACIVLTNIEHLTKEFSYNVNTWTLHTFHTEIANAAPLESLDRIKVCLFAFLCLVLTIR